MHYHRSVHVRVGFPAYALQNNNANIHRVEERLKSLKAVKEKGTKETEFELFKVVENGKGSRWLRRRSVPHQRYKNRKK